MARNKAPRHTTYGDYLAREAATNRSQGRKAMIGGAATTAIGAAVAATTAGVGGMAIMAPGTAAMLHGQSLREQARSRQAKSRTTEGLAAAVKGGSATKAMHGAKQPGVGKDRTDPYVDTKGRNYAQGRKITKGK